MEKKKFTVQITEYASKTFEVEAEDMEKAVEEIRKAYRNEEINLCDDVIVAVKYDILDDDNGFTLYSEED